MTDTYKGTVVYWIGGMYDTRDPLKTYGSIPPEGTTLITKQEYKKWLKDHNDTIAKEYKKAYGFDAGDDKLVPFEDKDED